VKPGGNTKYTGSRAEESLPLKGVHVKAEAWLPAGHITAPGAWPHGNPKREGADKNAAGAYLKRKKDRCAKSQKIWTISRFVRVILAQGPC
jgi:hypothetical protein